MPLPREIDHHRVKPGDVDQVRRCIADPALGAGAIGPQMGKKFHFLRLEIIDAPWAEPGVADEDFGPLIASIGKMTVLLIDWPR